MIVMSFCFRWVFVQQMVCCFFGFLREERKGKQRHHPSWCGGFPENNGFDWFKPYGRNERANPMATRSIILVRIGCNRGIAIRNNLHGKPGDQFGKTQMVLEQ